MKSHFFFFDEKYREFKISQKLFYVRMIKGIRVCLSIMIIIYMVVVLPLIGDVLPLHNFLLPPIILILHGLLSTIVLKQQIWSVCIHFLSLEISMILVLSLELSLNLEMGDKFLGIILGTKVGLVFSIILVSKLPFLNLLAFSIVSSVYTLIRCNTEGAFPVNSGLQIIISILILILYFQQEALDFKTFCELRRKHNNLHRFELLIKVFPNPILLVSKASLEKRSSVYVNEEAAKFYNSTGDLLEFLASFVIDEFSEEIGGQGIYRKNKHSLLEKINQRLQEGKETFTGFDFYSAKLHQKTRTPLLDNKLEGESAEREKLKTFSSANSKNSEKYEIKMGFLLWGDDEEDTLILIFNNISKTEKIKELHKNKDLLLASFSHGLKTPLNGVIGMIDTASADIIDMKTKNSLSVARDSAKTLLLMINNILDYSQIKDGSLFLKKESVKVAELLESMLPIASLQIKKKGLQLKFSNDCPVETCVLGDFGRLQQILFNLLSNSCKFTDEGFIHLQAYPEHPTEVGLPEVGCVVDFEDVVFKVSDTGKGIKEEFFPNLFTLFGKFDNFGNETGVGLGLTLSQRLVKMMSGGCIEFKSEYGKGSAFWIKLKRDLDFQDLQIDVKMKLYNKKYQNLAKEPVDRTFEISFKKEQNQRRVLVVDDDLTNHIVAENYLKSIDEFIIEKAFNGAEAVNSVIQGAKNEQFFDLVLMDINMPVMDGYQASIEIRKLVANGSIPNLVILAVTANVNAENKPEWLSKGINGVIPKPINKLEFKRIVQDFLKKEKCL